MCDFHPLSDRVFSAVQEGIRSHQALLGGDVTAITTALAVARHHKATGAIAVVVWLTPETFTAIQETPHAL